MNKSSNIFSIFLNQATRNQKQMITTLCLLFAFCSSAFIGIPIWFEEPKLLCLNPQNQYFSCTEEQMCTQHFPYKIDPVLSAVTLVSELNLLCERKYIKRLLLTVVYLGGFIGAIMNFLIYVKPASRKRALACLGILFSLANYFLILFSGSEYMVGVCLAIISFTSIIGNAYGFIIINEYFAGDLAKTATIFMRLFWGVFGICFGAFCYLIHSNWKLLFLTMGSLVLMDSLYLLLFKSETEIKEGLTKGPTNILGFLRELSHLKQVRINFCIYVFMWTASSITYNAVWLELESLGGNFYLNMMLVSTIEILASFGASVVSLKFNMGNALKNIMKVLVIIFASFIFIPISLGESDNKLLSTISIILTLLGKFLSEIVSNITYVHTPKMTTDRFIPLYMVSVRLFSRICLLFLPYMNYLFISIHLHAFVFLGFVWGLTGVLLMFAKEIQPQGIEELLNEFKIDLVSRLSVFSASSVLSHAPEEILSNYKIDETNLRDIIRLRRASLHQSLMIHTKVNEDKKHYRDDFELNFG